MVKKVIRTDRKVIYLETISNPMMGVADIPAIPIWQKKRSDAFCRQHLCHPVALSYFHNGCRCSASRSNKISQRLHWCYGRSPGSKTFVLGEEP